MRIDEGGFEALGAVYGHDAHFVAAGVEIALDRVLGGSEAVEEGRQRRRLRRFGIVREAEEGVDRVPRLAAEPGDEAGAPAARTEQRRIEAERPLRPREDPARRRARRRQR